MFYVLLLHHLHLLRDEFVGSNCRRLITITMVKSLGGEEGEEEEEEEKKEDNNHELL